ncbi:hypothetical protein T484DRAFT_1806771 [Baffinella frigidus]|nr:hypothetical protein T484DRAFT_1806771 [Cryptophyta sp. CCMP2293]
MADVSPPQVLDEVETDASPAAAPAMHVVGTIETGFQRTTTHHVGRMERVQILTTILAEDLHKGATRLVDNLLEEKKATKQKARQRRGEDHGPVAAPAMPSFTATIEQGIQRTKRQVEGIEHVHFLTSVWVEDLHKGATRMMDNLLEDKETAERKKRVRSDIKKMWEIYWQNLEAGHICVPHPIEIRAFDPIGHIRAPHPSEDDLQDAEAPPASVSSQRASSPVSRPGSPQTPNVAGVCAVWPAAPCASGGGRDFDASPSAMSRLGTDRQHTSSPAQEGGEEGRGEEGVGGGGGGVGANRQRTSSGGEEGGGADRQKLSVIDDASPPTLNPERTPVSTLTVGEGCGTPPRHREDLASPDLAAELLPPGDLAAALRFTRL